MRLGLSHILVRVHRVLVLAFVLIGSAHSAIAQASFQTVLDFIAAQEAVYQPEATSADIEYYLAYMVDEITDHHAAYGVTLEGKDVFRDNLPDKARSSITYRIEVEDVTIGSRVAVVTFVEESRSRDGAEVVDFTGRTIMVLEFNETGLIQHMRRYLD